MTVSLLNKNVEDIIVSGYTELEETGHFSPMMWWVYLKLEDGYILLTSNDGTISIEEKHSIECNFDIEEDDLFTISSFSKSEYGLISKVDFFYLDTITLSAVGISVSGNYILFDAINIDGFNIQQRLNRDTVINSNKSIRIETKEN